MSSITVHMIFQGLIAFSPIYDSSQMANHMTALAVNSNLIPDSKCKEVHMAMIEFPTSSADCSDLSGIDCNWSGGKCQCTLQRHEIELLPDVNPDPTSLSRQSPVGVLPASQADAGDFSHVAHLSSMGYTLDPRYRQPVPPTPLVARFTFPFSSVLACDHAIRPDNLADNVHSFQFHKLGERGEVDQLHQAVAQSLVAKVIVDTTSGVPAVQLRQFDSAETHVFPLKIANPSEGLLIRVMNHREVLPLGDFCDDGIGRDFALFYELVPNPPAWTQRLIPHLKFTSAISQSLIDPTECEILKVPMSRPVCPIAAF